MKKKMKKQKSKVKKLGIWLIIIGLAFQFINILTYGLWEIDIDIFGVLIFIIGLVLVIVNWKK
jgi:multisubunit Na+/H+ antiporter MnhG subunit